MKDNKDNISQGSDCHDSLDSQVKESHDSTSIHEKRNRLPVVTYIAVMSVCFIINLPGVAVAPIEGKLEKLLNTSELEIQFLTTLPNFVIIPFVLLAGKFSGFAHKMFLIVFALLLFVGCGFWYIFSSDMTDMIIASCLLGVADGILIPFAMGFIVNSFQGKYLTRNLGIKSAVSNFGTVVASFVVGMLISGHNWRLPFVVYLVAIVPLSLCYWLRYVPGFGVPLLPSSVQLEENSEICMKDIDSRKIWGLIGNNFFITFMTFSIVIYLPQLIQSKGWSPKIAGDIGAVFFISVLVAGFFLEIFIRHIRALVFPVLGSLLCGGIALILFVGEEWAMYVGAVSAGLAFGIFQPLIYDKTSYAVNNPKKNIFALSLVLTALYIAIALEPFVITLISKIFKLQNENIFSFELSFYLAIIYIFLSFLYRRKFPFSIQPSYYS